MFPEWPSMFPEWSSMFPETSLQMELGGKVPEFIYHHQYNNKDNASAPLLLRVRLPLLSSAVLLYTTIIKITLIIGSSIL
jgi:hypothetical protein